MKKFFEEFKKFAMRGNVMDMAVGVIVGGAFGKIVTSLINTIDEAAAAGIATFNYGNFIQTVIDFILVALCIFLFIKLVNKLEHKKPEAPAPEPRKCPYCFSVIDDKATRCPHCTSMLEEKK